MQTLAWQRARVIDDVRSRVWAYLSPASTPDEVVLEASALLGMSEIDVRTLARLHFLLSPELASAIADVPLLLRRLPTTSALQEERSHERIRGPILWGKTLASRQGADPTLFVTAPPIRAHTTPEAETLAFLLTATKRLGLETDWIGASKGDAAMQIGSITRAATRWLESRMLSSLEVRRPSERDLARIRTGKHRTRFRNVLAAYRIYEGLVGRGDRALLQQLVETRGLVARPDSTLFEIYCLFRVVEELELHGWSFPTLRLFGGGLWGRATRGPETVKLFYQHSPQAMTVRSRYVALLATHRFAQLSDLRPDLVIEWERADVRRWLLIEAKMGAKRSAEASAREGLADLLAYSESYGDVLDSQPPPVGLAIAWGKGLVPEPERIMLCTPEHIGQALNLFLGD